MSHYRKIDTRVWGDRKFAALSDDGQLLFFRLLTHPNMTGLGAMRAGVGGLTEEAGWKIERFKRAFAELTAVGMVEYDAQAHLICFPNFARYNRPESPNVVRGWAKAFATLPESPYERLPQGVSAIFWKASGKPFRKPFRKPCAKPWASPGLIRNRSRNRSRRKSPPVL